MNCKCINKDLKIAIIGCGFIFTGLYYLVSQKDMDQYDEDYEN